MPACPVCIVLLEGWNTAALCSPTSQGCTVCSEGHARIGGSAYSHVKFTTSHVVNLA